MTEKEAIAYIEDYSWHTTRMGLVRINELLDKLGNPQLGMKFIHVTGSNGKGSTCAMLDSVLRQAGYKTGFYSSPYLQVFNERVKVNGQNIPGEALARLTEKVKVIADAMENHPSQFEIITTIAMMYFKEMECDIIVLEVGMGGELDATNVIEAPEVAVLTNIGLEHTEYLGDTIEEIARTKSGIIKTGCDCVCYDSVPEAVDTVRQICRDKKVNFYLAGFDDVKVVDSDIHGQTFVKDGEEYHIKLLGKHQINNAVVALEVIKRLICRGWRIGKDDIKEGFEKCSWPARLEVLSWEPLFILDGGHNPQCAKALTEALTDLLPGKKVTFLTGVLADKDYRLIVDTIRPFAERFVCVTPVSDRALAADEYAGYLKSLGESAIYFETIEEGLNEAMKSDTIVAFGSLYQAGAIRDIFEGGKQNVSE